MGILNKKIIRDLRYNKGRSFSIIAILMIATSLYSGLLLTYFNIDQTFDEIEEELSLHSVRFNLQNNTSPQLINFDNIPEIEAWDYRLSLITLLKLDLNEDTSYTAPIYGLPVHRDIRVDKLDVLEGNMIANSGEVMLSKAFVEQSTIEIQDAVHIFSPSGWVEYEVTAKIFSGEYLYNVNPITGLPDLQTLSPTWIGLQDMQELFDLDDVVNQVLIRFKQEIVDDESKFNTAIDKIEQRLNSLNTEVTHVKFSDEMDQKMKEGDVGALDDFARIFGFVILFIALFAIYDNISKLIANQRKYIGTMRALGGDKSVVSIHYTKLASILGFIGVFLGIPLGWLVSYGMTVEYIHLMGIPRAETGFRMYPFFEASLLIFIMCVIIGFISSLAAVNIQPREAMSSSFISVIFGKKPLIEKFLTKIPGMRSISASIPIRNLFRHRKKTIITILTFSLSIVLMTTSMSFMDSFNHALDTNYSEYQKYDLEVYFDQDIDLASWHSLIASIDGIDIFEGFVYKQIEIQYGNIQKSTSMYGYLHNSQLRVVPMLTGSFDGVTVGGILAEDLNIKKGDSVNIFNDSMIVTGLSSDILGESVFLPILQMQTYYQLHQNVSGIIIQTTDTVSEKDVKSDLEESGLPISVIISTDQVVASIQYLIQGLYAMVGIMIFIGFITVALFSFNTIVLEIMSREGEFVNIRTLGGGNLKVSRIIIIQGLIISIFGSIISIPISYLIADMVNSALVEGLMQITTVIYLESYIYSILSAMIASLIGIIAAIRHVLKINLVNFLRIRTNN
ncbi:MAG: FtsX-like permease family protein [Candidatus Heimdallarchaeota archaeon]|nr:FtsX-like permease family protein [Candidatus Heimdallarchaeota archaeon]